MRMLPTPQMLTNVEVAVSNLTSVPDDLPDKWLTLSTLYIEHTLVDVFPDEPLTMGVSETSP
ncbi:TPA: hypothetical protein N0F65_012096 [Lagenidium giganteum]|uniref:Uncharacterized protein n=1 Tax=Lagenidium giganteum TaxID=4803 RepID=A0AAV2YUQ5_9STRA|nr:TPA: hypothetical protein N0F65_012096 [Lagenidium giganteum]